VSRGIDKWLWFAEAHLQAEKITGSAGSRLKLRLVETDGKDPNTKTFVLDTELDITATNGDLLYKISPGFKVVVQLGGSAEFPLCTMTFSYLGTEVGWRVISGGLLGIVNVQTNEEHDGFPPFTPCQGIKNYPVQWAITISQPPYNVVGWFAGLNGNVDYNITAGTWQKC
jgi:hypothetical protein